MGSPAELGGRYVVSLGIAQSFILIYFSDGQNVVREAF